MKFSLLFLFLLTFLSVNSQTKVDNAISKVKEFYLAKNAGFVKGSFYYNKSENIMEILDLQVPLFEIKCTYQYNDGDSRFGKYLVKFHCSTPEENCIINSKDRNDLSSGFGVPFKSKDDCYTFINLISELKKALNTN